MSNRDARVPVAFFIAEMEKKEMELTIREKEVLNVFPMKQGVIGIRSE